MDLRRAALVMQHEGFHYPIHYGLIVNTRRSGSNCKLLMSPRQFTSVNKMSSF